ncbi:hypothetical protein [Mangrovihabitans endophyticus]|uniref:Uncharacterized protein n=1 Tax=Mangrovihabitans endophyticus TaxID=1751298 RepID=A0A8J3C1Z6_9ACTN|nr:hypothetical protein [Mangrovihabitans endophyticus]GGK98551.1 hypothetical protein GCM10012284_36030 [Mangrovihabitans endophyticus]
MAADANMPGTGVSQGSVDRAHRAGTDGEGHLAVSELIADRPAAPSPFGDDQTFPLPAEHLTYKPATAP